MEFNQENAAQKSSKMMRGLLNLETWISKRVALVTGRGIYGSERMGLDRKFNSLFYDCAS